MRVRWFVGVALVVAVGLALVGGAVVVLDAFGDPDDSQSVTAKSAAEEPFGGDLSGKAGAERALECSMETFGRGQGDPESGLEENGDSPGLGLDSWLDPEARFHQVPDTGYALETEDGDRALLSYDNDDGRTVIAFVMRDGQRDYYDEDEGWMVESYAYCDPAEWPGHVTDDLDIGIWRDATGRNVSVETIVSFHGAEHCGWQDTTFIRLGGDGADGEFLGNPDLDLREALRATYELDVPVPDDARDTGYERGGRRLLVAADGSAAYLVPTYQGADQSVGDRWPATKEQIGCA